MGKILLASILAASLGGAAVTVGQTYYSSTFQYDFCPGGAFKVTPSPGNVWHWEGDVDNAGVNVLVDINGDGIMDSEHPEVRVCITDIQNAGSVNVNIIDSSGVRWFLGAVGSVTNVHSFTTPIVLPPHSPLTLQGLSGVGSSRVRLIGRVINI